MNIPVKETIKIVLNALYRDPQISPPPQPENLRKLLLKLMSEVEFSFHGIMYRQVDSVGMGSLLDPILANIFVSPVQYLLHIDGNKTSTLGRIVFVCSIS